MQRRPDNISGRRCSFSTRCKISAAILHFFRKKVVLYALYATENSYLCTPIVYFQAKTTIFGLPIRKLFKSYVSDKSDQNSADLSIS